MSIDERIVEAWREYINSGGITDRIVSHASFTAGYRAALRSLFVEVKQNEIEDGDLYDVLVSSGEYHSAFALVHCAEVSFWFHRFNGKGEVEEVFINPLEIKSVYSQRIPSPSEVFGEV